MLHLLLIVFCLGDSEMRALVRMQNSAKSPARQGDGDAEQTELELTVFGLQVLFGQCPKPQCAVLHVGQPLLLCF